MTPEEKIELLQKAYIQAQQQEYVAWLNWSVLNNQSKFLLRLLGEIKEREE